MKDGTAKGGPRVFTPTDDHNNKKDPVVERSEVSQYLKTTYKDLPESGWASFTKKWPYSRDLSEAAPGLRALQEQLWYDNIGQVIVECITIDLA